MSRCTKIRNLEVHHKRRDGGDKLANAEVLCKDCHAATATYGSPGTSPPPFSSLTKLLALKRADSRCECIKVADCH